MSKLNTNSMPVLGSPVFRISENLLTDKVSLSDSGGLLNALVYFAVDGVLVKKEEYEDDKMNVVIINKGMVDEENDHKSLEIRYDLNKNDDRKQSSPSVSIYVDEADAQLVAKKLNENQKINAKKLMELAIKVYNSYDQIIAACVVK